MTRGARLRVSVWVFLAWGRFATKDPDYAGWILLDFLGFSGPTRDLSMGYEGFSVEDFSLPFFKVLHAPDVGACGLWALGRGNIHRASIVLLLIFRKRLLSHPALRQARGASVPVARPAAANQFGRRLSSQSSTRSRKRRKGGMSSAKSMRPSGNIQRPKIGRMARHPPMISSMPAGTRAQREAGFLSHRVIACIRFGSRRRSRLSRRSGAA
jgi:hypothetical protein